MKGVKYYFKLLLAVIVHYKGLILISIVVGALFFVILNIVNIRFFNKKITKIGITGHYHIDDLPNEILEKIGAGLTKVDSGGNITPGLATNWDTSDKGKTWIFRLDNNKNWHDETTLSSTDINYDFSDIEIEKTDESTLIFKLKNPLSSFPYIVTRPIFKKGLLGTGDWEVKNLNLSGSFVNQLTLANNSEKIIYKFYPTTERTKLALKLGEVDTLINQLDPAPFNTWATTDISSYSNDNQVVTLFFNSVDPVLSEKSLRQSLSYAINKDALEGKRAISPISPLSWAYNPQVKDYTYDTKRAKELIDELPDQQQNNLEIKLVTTPVLLPVAEKIADDWKEIGVDTIVQVSSIIPSEFQAYLTILDIPKDPDQYSIWHSTQSNSNISKYASPRIDKLLEEGRSILDIDERKKTYIDFQRFLLEDAPAAFLFHPTYYTIKRK